MTELGDVVASPRPPAPDDSDREAIERLAAGELDALEKLYERYGTMAYSIALRITNDTTAAEDVVQEAFLGAWRNASRYVAGRGSVKTWLLAIVHHRSIDAIRRRRPTVEFPDAEGPTPEPLTLPDVWSDVSSGLDREAVAGALASIPAAQREALELAYFGGLTQVEIATRLNAPLGTIKSRMRLGLLALGRALGAEMPDG
jgi:RNA polymerase sigma-70 factor (ECF subfamily)